MPRPQKGEKTPGSGRARGTPNKNTMRVQELCDRMGHNPFENLINIANNNVPCGKCRGKLKTRYKLEEPKDHCEKCDSVPGSADPNCIYCSGTGQQMISERTCMSCYADGWEHISPELRHKADSDLTKFLQPQLKAVEHSNPDGTMRPSWLVTLAPEVKKLE